MSEQSNNPLPVFHPSNAKKKREMYAATCKDCGKACEVPFQPTPDRPAFCKECFEKRKQGRQQRNGPKQPQQQKLQKQAVQMPSAHADVSRRIDMLNSKLDRLIAMMESHVHAPAPKEKKVALKKTAKKAAKKKTIK